MSYYEKSAKNITNIKNIFHTLFIFSIGLITGILIKILDIYTTDLGNIFSNISIWILICTVISIYSKTPLKAGWNVFSFCIGMLLTYYITAEITSSIYSLSIAYGWITFSFFTFPMGYLIWYLKKDSWYSKIMYWIIILLTIVISIILFDKIRASDILFTILISLLLKDKRKRGK